MDAWTKNIKERLLNKKRIYESEEFRRVRPPEAVAMKTHIALPYIEAALRRIDEGTYENCVDCGVNISRERHETTPGAIRCVDCQAGLETSNAR